MFEFDEHYIELEAFETSLADSAQQDNDGLTSWQYMGHDVWKLDFDGDVVMATADWAIETADVA